jgi:hypothetical protein
MGTVNDYSQVVMCVLTFVYVIATAFLVWVGIKQSKIASDSLRMLSIAEHDRKRPYVMLTLVSRETTVYAEIKNYGQSPACNVRVTFEGKSREGLWDDLGVITTGITMLGPNGIYSVPVSDLQDLCSKHHDCKFRGAIHYESTIESGQETYSESFLHDLSHAFKTYSIETSTSGKHASLDAKLIANEIRNLRGEQSF